MQLAVASGLGLMKTSGIGRGEGKSDEAVPPKGAADPDLLTLFVCGDVMTGRGLDQILPHPNPPQIYEPYVTSALDYVRLAERLNGPIPRAVDFDYVWGDALAELRDQWPDLRIINLETSVTTNADPAPKGINYRMSPANIGCLLAADIDCGVLANNHVLDWGEKGLVETLEVLQRARIRYAGAGLDKAAAAAPAALTIPGGGRILVYAFAHESSGVPDGWAATDERPGVNVLLDLSTKSVDRIRRRVHEEKRSGDVAVASIHWGRNWGYAVPAEHASFARQLIDAAAIDIVHGHSSHHPRPIEIHRGKLILYGCGDFLNDYEGIEGYEQFRGDLVLMYFVRIHRGNGTLHALEMTPLQIKNFRLNRAADADAAWLAALLDKVSRPFGTSVQLTADNRLRARRA